MRQAFEEVIAIEIDRVSVWGGHHRITLGDVESLALQIREVGQIAPIIVRAVGSRYEIADGVRRFTAIQWLHARGDAAGEPSGDARENTILAIVREIDDSGMRRYQLASASALALNPLDASELIAEALDAGERASVIAEVSGRSVADVQRLATIRSLCAAGRAAVAKGGLSVDAAIALARVPSQSRQADIIDAHRHALAESEPAIIAAAREAARMRHIAIAPWSTSRVGLPGRTTSCDGCTARTSCQRDLFSDLALAAGAGETDDFCADPACWDARSAAAIAEMRRLIPEERHLPNTPDMWAEPAPSRPDRHRAVVYDAAWVPATDEVIDPSGRVRTVAALIGKRAHPYLAIDPDGLPRLMYDRQDLLSAQRQDQAAERARVRAESADAVDGTADSREAEAREAEAEAERLQIAARAARVEFARAVLARRIPIATIAAEISRIAAARGWVEYPEVHAEISGARAICRASEVDVAIAALIASAGALPPAALLELIPPMPAAGGRSVAPKGKAKPTAKPKAKAGKARRR